MTGPRRAAAASLAETDGDERNDRADRLKAKDTGAVNPPGLCWFACAASRCACCPLASEVER